VAKPMTNSYESNVKEQQSKLADNRFFPFVKFSEPLESEFREYRHQRLLERIPAIGAAGLFIFILFAVLDVYTLAEPAYYITSSIRLFIVCPLIVLVIIAARLHWSINAYSALYMSAYVISGLSIVAIMYTTRVNNSEMPYDGILLHLVFGYFLMGSPYTLATLGGVLVSIGYFSFEFTLDAPPHVLGFNAAFIITLNFMGAVGSYMQERSRRSLFLNKKLVELAKAKDEQEISSRTRLLATASHDLRQPLHAMSLLIESLESQVPKGDSLVLTQKLKLAINQLSQLLGSLLNISRLNAGIVEARVINFDLATLVKSLLPEQKLRAEELGISIEMTGPAPCPVKSDPILVERIFRNLCENVFTHADATEIHVTWSKQGDSIVLEIEDNGKGLSETEMSRIFDEFHQADQTNQQGMGLGLAIVKQLSELLDMSYGVKQGKNKGLCFWFEMKQAYSLEQTNNDAELVNLPNQEGKHILLVDDDPAIVDSCQILLEKWGYRVTTAHNPVDALSLLECGDVDLLICDYRFAGFEQNGIELISESRRKNKPELPAILITADTQQEVSEEVQHSFMEKDLKITVIAFKPLAPAKLKLMIQHYL
jgi:signal transduction histidine kinase/CheY-like chemotaxis protein